MCVCVYVHVSFSNIMYVYVSFPTVINENEKINHWIGWMFDVCIDCKSQAI